MAAINWGASARGKFQTRTGTRFWCPSSNALANRRRLAAAQQAGKSKAGEIWRKVANETLERTGDEGRAIREANAVIDRIHEKSPDAPWEDS